MKCLALATDYDGTIAHHGAVAEATIDALERFRASARKLILVTGRELPDLRKIFLYFTLFDRIVAENGAVLFSPATGEEQLLSQPPSKEFAELLRARGVKDLSVGRVIVATQESYEHVVMEAIHDLDLDLRVILNKGAVMVLPSLVNKGTGLDAALTELGLAPSEVIAVGDAENDHDFMDICGYAVAVANALSSVKERANCVTARHHGEGVIELIEQVLADDLTPIQI